MREILFRGKRTDNGEWVTGIPAGGFVMICGMTTGFYDDDVPMSAYREFDWAEVDQKTIGQYTGLTDKNGAKIFEGDLLQGKNKRIFKVRYIDGIAGFSAKPTDERKVEYPCMNWGTMQDYKIIGNIHDNAELLLVTGEDIGNADTDTLRPAT